MMRIITFGDYKTVYLSCCVDVVAKGGGSNKVAKRDDGGIAKERSGLAARVRAVCPETSYGSYNEHDHLLDRGAWWTWLARGRDRCTWYNNMTVVVL
jgi:hypothetical protein